MIALPPRITQANAPAALAQLLPALHQAEGNRLALNAANLEHFDSSALAVLLECQRQLQKQGKNLHIAQAPARLLELSALYGISGILGLEPSASAQ